jgi:hypothetical protein
MKDNSRAQPAEGARFNLFEFDLTLYEPGTHAEAPGVFYLGRPGKVADREAMQADKGACWLPTLRCTWEELESREGVPYLLYSVEEFDNVRAGKYIEEPRAITEADYWEQLEVLPPQRWHRGAEFEAFHCLERYSGDVARWTVRLGRGEGATYWAFNDRTGSTYAHLEAKARAALGKVAA